ncbi:hypothetical protein D9M68_834890 [compost metagenome]
MTVHHIDPLMDRAAKLIVGYFCDDEPIFLPPGSPLAAKIFELDPEVVICDNQLLDRHWEAMTPDQRLITRQAALDAAKESSDNQWLDGLGPKVRFHRELCGLLAGIEAGVATPPWTWGRYEVVDL